MAPQFQKFDDIRGNTLDYLALSRFYGGDYNDQKLCLRELSKSLTDRAYTCYVNLKHGFIHDWRHLVSLLNIKFSYAEAKFTFAELSRTHQYPRVDLNACAKSFDEISLTAVKKMS